VHELRFKELIVRDFLTALHCGRARIINLRAKISSTFLLKFLSNDSGMKVARTRHRRHWGKWGFQPTRGSWERLELLYSGVRGRASAENEFGSF